MREKYRAETGGICGRRECLNGGGMMAKKVGVVSLGCPKNLVDSEEMLGILRDKGYVITSDEKEAEVIIVNTCAFIEAAKQEAVNTILEMAGYKSGGKCKKLVVAGCLAERYKDDILKEISEVDAVVGVGSFREISRVLDDLYRAGKSLVCVEPDGCPGEPGVRMLSNPYYAYLKIAEGCDNCCTYCVIPQIRGRLRSRNIEAVMEEAEFLVSRGIREVVLVAQDTTRYGLDIYGERKLAELLRRLDKTDGLERIRVLYCYPDGITDELIEIIGNSDRICRYVDLPIQHVSDRILKNMGRRGSIKDILELIGKLRAEIPGVVLRTSLITGFPGETEQDFELMKQFVRETQFERLGVFAYSAEEGTPAAHMAGQVSKRVKEERRDAVMRIQADISREKNKKRVGNVYNVLVEGVADDGIFYFGRSYAEAPEIDGKIYFTSPCELKLGEFKEVRILDSDEYDLIGEALIIDN